MGHLITLLGALWLAIFVHMHEHTKLIGDNSAVSEYDKKYSAVMIVLGVVIVGYGVYHAKTHAHRE